MNHVLPWLTCLGMAMYQFHATQSIQLMVTNKFPPEQLYLAVTGYCLGIFAGWVAVSVAVREHPTANTTVPSDRTNIWILCLAIFSLAAFGIRLYLFDEWQSQVARAALQVGSGFLLVVVHWLFFTIVQVRHQAFLYCMTLATGLGLAELHYRIVYAGTGLGGIPVSLHRTLIFTTLVYVIIVCCCLWMVARSGTIGNGTRAEDRGSVRCAGSLVLLLVLLYILHGMVNGSFLPFYTVSRVQDNRAVTAALTVVFLGIGARLFRKGVSHAYMPVVTVCGILHMAMAVFSLFTTDLFLIRILHSLIGPVQILFTAMVVCALARTAPRRWRIAAVTLPYALKAAETLFIPFLLQGVIGKGEAIPLAAILVAVAFYALGRKIAPAPLDPYDTMPLEPGVSTTLALDDTAPTACREVIRELSDCYGFSERERQVGELLASGMTADRIGVRLGLSINTVNTYVRRIVTKTGCGGRRGFVSLVRGKLDDKE